eukprot:TRINITY_DN42163_c0_g1_i1.p1 TRINITY_DN42163_c0_g1~~TRINITY_DN42163_c0_g1_i1.p1  ORF type:complete len:106 (+),score=55.22 TRINITY_DN42163_c0_g1_i1:102-419(+)
MCIRDRDKKAEFSPELLALAGVKAGCRIKDVEKLVKELKKEITALNKDEDSEKKGKKVAFGEEDEEDEEHEELAKDMRVSKDRDLKQGREADRKKKDKLLAVEED